MILRDHAKIKHLGRLAVVGLACSLSACQTTSPYADQAFVSSQLNEKAGYHLNDKNTADFVIPEGLSLTDGLTEDDAIAIALWNNATFKQALTDLDISRGDLVQAGLLPNPEASYAFEMTDKPFKYAVEFPIEALWLRPIRVKSMKNEAERQAQTLVQTALDLIRDVRQSYADALLAQERSEVAEEAKTLRTHIADMAGKRFDAGDITQQEVGTAQIDALQATQNAARASYDKPITIEKLRNLTGMSNIERDKNIVLVPEPLPACLVMNEDTLVADALQNRPDIQAAQKNITAAKSRLTLAKTGWVRLLGTADANSGKSGHELGPSMKFTLPLFNRNQGGIMRAEAEYQKAKLAYETLFQQISMDVRQSYLQYQQTCQEWEIVHDQVRPQVEAAITRSEKAYQEGDIAYLMVLQSTQQLFDNHYRQVQVNSDLRRVWAQLERSLGKRLEGTTQ